MFSTVRTMAVISISSALTTYLLTVLSGSTGGRTAVTTISAASSTDSESLKSTVVVKSVRTATSVCRCLV